jgi:hypothetical protein
VAVSACHLVPHRIYRVPVCHGPRSDDLGDVFRRFIYSLIHTGDAVLSQ